MGILVRVFGAFVLLVSSARADEIYLEGGRVLQGEASIEGDKVKVALESGRVSIPRSEVLKIVQSSSPLQQAQAREATLGAHDVSGLLQLADFCRDHDLLNKERSLLERIIALEPNHADARRRLGYVREGGKWLERSEVARREQLARNADKQQRLATAQREAELQLVQARVERERERADRREEEQKQRAAADAFNVREERRYMFTPLAQPYSFYGPQVRYARPGGALSPPRAPPAFSIPGVRAPTEYFDDARRR